jgi:hypothetical protein
MFAKNYAKLYDCINSGKAYKDEIDFVYKWAGKPKSIFDIGPGTASYWCYYPENVILKGLDKSREMAKFNQNVECGDIESYRTTKRYDCVTALFDVINYIPEHDWWKHIPVKKGGYFIFDIWNKKKVAKDGFKPTHKMVGKVERKITPMEYDGEKVHLHIEVFGDVIGNIEEEHIMYLYDEQDIMDFCGEHFEIVEMKDTNTWQQWFKCKRK